MSKVLIIKQIQTKQVPLSFRQHPGIKARGDVLEVVQDGVGVL